MIKKSYAIVGMHCASCAKLIERKIKRIDGVSSASVNYGNETAYIESSLNIDNKIKDAVEGLGYKVGVDVEAEKKKEIKNLKIKVAVSLASAALVMFFPEYFYFLAFPIQLIIGLEFYQSLWSDIRNLSFGMNSLVAIGTTAAVIGGYYETSVTIIALILLGRFLELNAKGKSSEAIKKLMGLQKELDQNLLVGDVVHIKPGQKIPTDGVVTSGESFVDESMITGEAIPVHKNKGDAVTGGTINKNGSFTFKVTKVGKETVLAQIIKMVSDAQGSRAEIQKLVDLVSSYFIPLVLIVALVTFYFFGITNAIAVLVIACPCAMGLATPTAILVSVGTAAKRGILIRDIQALEILNRVKNIVFDKTGTLTEGRPVVTDYEGDKKYLAIAASLELNSEHPIALAVIQKAKDLKLKTMNVAKFKALEGLGVEGFVSGRKYFLGKTNNAGVSLVSDGKTLASFRVADNPRKYAKEVVESIKSRGVTPWMITGDNKENAKTVAKKVGISNIVAEVMPNEKALEVKKIGSVAFVGDGINDAPALASSDVGIAMGSGTDIAIESAGITLMNKDFRTILTLLNLSKKTLGIITQNLFWAFGYNVVLIPVAALGYLNPMLAAAAMSLSSISVVLNSLRLSRVRI